MADSFFGFDASIPLDDDSGGGLEDSEDMYDALNSETFGSAINGDWENIHENLVRLDGHRLGGPAANAAKSSRNAAAAAAAAAAASADLKDDNGESDLELNFSRVGMNDFDVAKEDNEGRILLDPSVWANTLRPATQPTQPATHQQLQHQLHQLLQQSSSSSSGGGGNNNTNGPPAADNLFFNNSDLFMRPNYAHPFGAPASATNAPSSAAPGGPSAAQLLQQQQHMHQQQQQLLMQKQFQMHQQQQQLRMHQQQQAHLLSQQSVIDGLAAKASSLKIMSVEDLERGIRPGAIGADADAEPTSGGAATAAAAAISKPQQQQLLASSRSQTPLLQQLKSATGNNNSSTGNPTPRLPPGFAPIAMAAAPPKPGGIVSSPLPLHANAIGGALNLANIVAGGNAGMQRPAPPMLPSSSVAFAGMPGMPFNSLMPPPRQGGGGGPQQQQQQQQQQQSQLPPIGGGRPPMHPMMNTPPPNHPGFGGHNMPPNMGPNMPSNMQFNQRLVHEIQQNHPMLAQFNRPGLGPFPGMHPLMQQHHMHMQQMMQHQQHMHMQGPPPNHPFMQQHHQQMNQMLQHQQHHQQHQQHQQQHQQQQHNGMDHGQQQQQQQQHRGQRPSSKQQPFRVGNGNLGDDYDDYANLMSMRDKQWLITIQLSQLRTDTPYLDDYYFTVHRERRQKASGQRENKAHQDNQMNHPFTQPSGQVGQLARITWNQKGHQQQHHNSSNSSSTGSGGNSNNQNSSSNNNSNNQQQRNGRNSSNNGNSNEHNHHNRRTSESSNNKNSNNNNNNNNGKDEKENTPRTYAPQQFENSLGKLQCGSVTAPRKVIDMDVVGAESATGGGLGGPLEITTQRKSRQLLWHIELLYKLVLKLEDMEHPTAIAANKLVADRKAAEYKDQLATREELRTISQDPNVPADVRDKVARSLAVEPAPLERGDTQPELLAKVLAGLGPEKAAQMMTVRKGKTLLRRTLPLVKDVAQRWDIWYGICSTLPIIVKKDKDDVDGLLFALFPLFKEQLSDAGMDELLKLAGLLTVGVDTRKVNYMFVNKFCISCVIVLLLRAEAIFVVAPETITATVQTRWAAFLQHMSTTAAANVQANQTLGAALPADMLAPLLNHFARFASVTAKPLIAALSPQAQAEATTTTSATTTATATRTSA